ncbi:hypothetical protein [Actinomadura atramentaria]|uniref:hypothetical protein n=1 Tax=Actinomadura atramentaria TaxID=1990 RepID=UPI00039CF5E5|nr:hypothetical protein [Actinomadura atramentaria]
MTAPTSAPATPEISLVEAVLRYRLMSVGIVVATVLAAVAATQILFGGATATARFAVTDPTNNNNVLRMGVVSGPGFATFTAQRAAFAGSAPVLARAAAILKAKHGVDLTPSQLRGRVQTSTKTDGGVVVVTAKGANMVEAAAIANAAVQAYREVTVSTNIARLDDQIKNLQALERKATQDMETATPGSRAYRLLTANLAKLQSEESGLLTAKGKTNDGLQFVDSADPTAPAPSKLPQNGVIGVAVGVILACVVAFLRASAPGRNSRRATPRPVGGSDPATPADPPLADPLLVDPPSVEPPRPAPRPARPDRRGRRAAPMPDLDPDVERVIQRAAHSFSQRRDAAESGTRESGPQRVEPRVEAVGEAVGDLPRASGESAVNGWGGSPAVPAAPADDETARDDDAKTPPRLGGDPTKTAEDDFFPQLPEDQPHHAHAGRRSRGKRGARTSGAHETPSLIKFNLDS